MTDNGAAGRIDRTVATSVPPQVQHKAVPTGPNVVVVLLDDTGFAHLGCYGSTIRTPNIDRLAAGGLRFTNFHTTALCSPTRAALLTGRNHHSVGMRGLSNWSSGFPNCTGRLSDNAATLAETLRDAGYSTFATGKWHLTPMDETSGAGPFDQWPLGRGFDRYYGFLQGETSQFHPELYCDNHPVDQPRSAEDGYHVTEDIIDQSIQMIRDQHSAVPEKPFFLYCAFGATHSPHHAPAEYIDRYRGAFDDGWDVTRQDWYERQLAMGIIPPGTELAPRNDGVEPWDQLTADEQRVAARLQEAFAGFLEHTDEQIGRLVDFLAQIDELDDTVFLLLSDNGASQEGGPIGVLDTLKWFNGVDETIDEVVGRIEEIGGPTSNNNYPWGWAQVGNTPLKRYKQNTHGGGIRDPLVVHWPAGISGGGGVRTQFHHVTDLVPTVLEITGVPAPSTYHGQAQLPLHGTSMRYAFDAPEAGSRKGTQYFEMFGHRGIWHDGWKAVAYHEKGTPFEQDRWELYHVAEDFSECNDLAQSEPAKLEEMVQRWWTEAGRYGVLPLDERGSELFGKHTGPGSPRNRRTFTYFPPLSHLNSDAAPGLGARSFRMTADVDAQADASGAIVSYGTSSSGFVFYLSDGCPVFHYNLYGTSSTARSAVPIPGGRCTVEVDFQRIDDKARAEVLLDGRCVAEVDIPGVLRLISVQGMDVGRDVGSLVSDDYEAPFAFPGRIERLVFDIPQRGAHAAESRAVEAAADLVQQ